MKGNRFSGEKVGQTRQHSGQRSIGSVEETEIKEG